MSTPIDRLMSTVEWMETGAAAGADDLPYATHSGVMDLAGFQLRCYRLNDGRAIVDADDFTAFWNSLTGEAA